MNKNTPISFHSQALLAAAAMLLIMTMGCGRQETQPKQATTTATNRVASQTQMAAVLQADAPKQVTVPTMPWPPKSDVEMDASWDGKLGTILQDGFEFKGATITINRYNEKELGPDPGKASGTIKSVVGKHQFTATITTAGFAYADRAMVKPLAAFPVITEGQLVVRYFFEDTFAPDQYVENSFSASLIGSNYVVITVDKSKGDRVIAAISEDGFGSSWLWPGSRVRVGERTLVRRTDGWYESGRKVSP